MPINRVFAFKTNKSHVSQVRNEFRFARFPSVGNCSFTGNYIHAQTFACLQNWLTDLEIFATLVAAIIHDYEHTGTTNNFHVMSGSDTALLYNDRAVLENHHISASFRYVGNNVVTRVYSSSSRLPAIFVSICEPLFPGTAFLVTRKSCYWNDNWWATWCAKR